MKNYCKSKLFTITIIVLLHNYFSMNFFKGRLTNRLALSKFIGFLFWGLAFFAIPYVFIHADILLRFGIWFWYISIWAVIGVFGVMDRFPIWNMRFPALLRWACLGAWMNFVLIFFISTFGFKTPFAFKPIVTIVSSVHKTLYKSIWLTEKLHMQCMTVGIT